jgi:hypothetical protein
MDMILEQKNEEDRFDGGKHYWANVIKRVEATKTESHYELIDNALQSEKELRGNIEKIRRTYRQEETDELNRKRWMLFADWVIGIALLTTAIYFIFSCKTIVIPAIISTIIMSPTIMYFMIITTADHITAIENYQREEELKTERCIVKMYTELLHNIDIYEFLDIPQNIIFNEKGLPCYEEKQDSSRPYGYLTRYIAPLSGTKYHIKCGCSGAFSAIHGFDLSLNEYHVGWKHYTPCQICIGSKDSIRVPKWYVYYRKVKDIANKYEIKINYHNIGEKEAFNV